MPDELRMKFKNLCLLALICVASSMQAHPMPYSVLLLDIGEQSVTAELQMPLKELQLVFPEEDIDSSATTLIQRKSEWLDEYLLRHLSVTDSLGNHWHIRINTKSIRTNEQPLTGPYHELVFTLLLQAPAGSSTRHFIMRYDAIMHQVVTHKLMIRIRQDWAGGLLSESDSSTEVGTLGVNTADGSIPPVIINLDAGSRWTGFRTMVRLGIDHIAAGTDHLLFLLVLLLPAALTVKKRRWSGFGGMNYSIVRLIKIVTAFTIGHSLSLLLGALKWMSLPQQPVEIAIAITILITAIHAIRPLFYGREMLVAAGFGLIHGLAFASVLTSLNLEAGNMALSILGFNIGIELMQLFVILCTIPWLVLMAQYPFYQWIRLTGALFAIMAAVGWMTERVTGQPNMVAVMIQDISSLGKWILIGLVMMSLMVSYMGKKANLQA